MGGGSPTDGPPLLLCRCQKLQSMSNLHRSPDSGLSGPVLPSSVHTTAQLPSNSPSDPKKWLKKRARRNMFGRVIKKALSALPDSPLLKSYFGSLLCQGEIEYYTDGEGNQKCKAKYCNSRWCLICSAIRTSKAIVKYAPVLAEMAKTDDWYFVTLSRPNVTADLLSDEIEHHLKWFRFVQKTEDRKKRRKQKFVLLDGIRKIEVTYNLKHQTYHPHLHILVHGRFAAEFLLNTWLSDNPTAMRFNSRGLAAGNEFRPVLGTENDLIEIFKYSTKAVGKYGQGSRFDAAMYDVCLSALRARRTFQGFGSLYGIVKEEDVKDLQNADVADILDGVYRWNVSDWLNDDLVCLSGFIPSSDDVEFINRIKTGSFIMAPIDVVDASASDDSGELLAYLARNVAPKNPGLTPGG